jgi:hypothetical protein
VSHFSNFTTGFYYTTPNLELKKVTCADDVLRDTTPRVPNGRKSRVGEIFFCLRKQPGGSASNRVFSLSVLKIDFFRGTLFFQVEDRSEAQTFTLQIQ